MYVCIYRTPRQTPYDKIPSTTTPPPEKPPQERTPTISKAVVVHWLTKPLHIGPSRFLQKANGISRITAANRRGSRRHGWEARVGWGRGDRGAETPKASRGLGNGEEPTRSLGERRELPQRDPGRAPAENGFQCFPSVTECLSLRCLSYIDVLSEDNLLMKKL